ncbi:MAG: enoyl-CoA hydratase [Deltaproteobacteria bacterium]|nr:enoyl-CoA hydratase [Deltaproteobacteria bacterium]MBW2420855.1 enoyl-CoA hydratase [Deltaproteobacteria bacterium]
MSESVLLVEKSEGIATLTLNRPKSMNALSAALRNAITLAFQELQDDDEVRVAIVTGAGRAFCAGLDLKELGSGAPEVGTESVRGDMMQAIGAFRGPVIGAVNGHAITGGFELALGCDLLIASSEAKFADTHARVGILPGWGLSQRLSRLIGIARAKEISLTGNYIEARQAEAWGLVNRVVEPDQLLPAARALAVDMASCPAHMVEGYKRLIDEGYGMPFEAAMKHEARAGIESAKAITAESIAAGRAAVQDRGRKQDAS